MTEVLAGISKIQVKKSTWAGEATTNLTSTKFIIRLVALFLYDEANREAETPKENTCRQLKAPIKLSYDSDRIEEQNERSIQGEVP